MLVLGQLLTNIILFIYQYCVSVKSVLIKCCISIGSVQSYSLNNVTLFIDQRCVLLQY